MNQLSFRAMVVEETEDHRFIRRITEKTVSALPKGDVLIKVHYSSLNYKDALSANGNKGVTRRYPHTPGVDAAGEVAESTVSDFVVGDRVLVTGHDMGMNTSGGFGQYIRVPAQWVVPLPKGLTLKESMMFGTAGFTAALSLIRLEETGLTPKNGQILVTGATGGVGSLAVAILSQRGYSVAAVTGKAEAKDFLTSLGAKEIVDRQTILDAPNKPLMPGRYAGVIDTVGGPILSYAIRSTQYGGVLTCCGNAASAEIQVTVYPFILRGIRLIGIDSAECSMELHHKVWQRLSSDWKLTGLDRFVKEVGLDDLEPLISKMMAGGITGRYLLNLNK
ncbi:MAG: YhdH/YhfP family quinone oxidoreductase [Desulfobacteraceae bacterium]|nr:YhdH/YhfP family quinone oxidoreductase [Desulfobacteraceae bacterium]